MAVQSNSDQDLTWLAIFQQHPPRVRLAVQHVAFVAAKELGAPNEGMLRKVLQQPGKIRRPEDKALLESFLEVLLTYGQALIDAVDEPHRSEAGAELFADRPERRAALASVVTRLREIDGLTAFLEQDAEQLFARPGVLKYQAEAVREMLRYLPGRLKLSRRVKLADALALHSEELVTAVSHLVEQRDALREVTRSDPTLLTELGRLLIAWGDGLRGSECLEVAADQVWAEKQKGRLLYDAAMAAVTALRPKRAIELYKRAVQLDRSGCALFDHERYQLQGFVSASSHSILFLVHDRRRRRFVVQCLFEKEAELKKIFKRVRPLQKLRNPHLVRLREWGWANRRRRRGPYLVWEHVEGQTLRERIEQRGMMSQPQVVMMMRALASGLRAALQIGILHRSLHPDKVRFDSEGNPRLLGFGLSRTELRVKLHFPELARQPSFLRQRIEDDRLYLAPEQRGTVDGRAGPHSDVYSLGRLACYALFGVPRPTPERLAELHPKLTGCLVRCLNRHPGNRFENARRLVKKLDELCAIPGLRPSDAVGGVPESAPVEAAASGFNTRRLIGFFGRLFKREQKDGGLWWKPTRSQRDATRDGALELWTKNGVDMDFVLIPEADGPIGSPEKEPHRRANERRHHVRLRYAYYMKATPVTQAEWYRVMGTRPFFFEDADGRVPAENLSWYDAIEFCNQLSEREGLEPAYNLIVRHREGGSISDAEVEFLGLTRAGYRLPTETEWELACRGGTDTPYWMGLERNVVGALACTAPRPVREHPANPYGLFAMHGNVWEWCWDWYAYEYPEEVQTNPTGPKEGDRRVKRGGSFAGSAELARSAFRGREVPAARQNDVGLRVVRTAIGDQSKRIRLLGVKG